MVEAFKEGLHISYLFILEGPLGLSLGDGMPSPRPWHTVHVLPYLSIFPISLSSWGPILCDQVQMIPNDGYSTNMIV